MRAGVAPHMASQGWGRVINFSGLSGSIIDTDRASLESRMKDYFSGMSFEELKEIHPEICRPRARYGPKYTRDRLRSVRRFESGSIVPYLLFPLDLRWIYYESFGKFLNERRPQLWDNLPGWD